MITLVDVKDWLKEKFPDAENFYIGRLENKKEKSIGVYDLNRSESTPLICIGGLEYNAYDVKEVSILIHWNKNANETEIAANKLFQILLNLNESEIRINNHDVYVLELLVKNPVDVGTTDSIYERVIEMRMYYERKENLNE